MASLEENLKAMVRIFRRECHRVLESERTTIRGSDEMLMALQLTMAEVNKQESGEFGVALSDVLLCWKCLLLDRLQLPGDGSPRPENYELIRQEYESFIKRTNTVDLIDVYSMFKQLRVDTDPEELLTPTQLLRFISGAADCTEERCSVPPCPSTPSSPTTPSSQPRPFTAQMQRVARRVFCSYLGLLVNCKNDLALANALDTPCRSLGRTAFTDIKHAARNNQTSLFLAVTSFVRAIQLGGKGYAPSESSPLRKHLKGLCEFVHFTDQLEEVLGETPGPSMAGAKLVARVRSALLKGRCSGDSMHGAVDAAANLLKEHIGRIHRSHQQSTVTTGISPARMKVHTINHATAYIGRETVKVLQTLLDEEALAPPCSNKAELLSEDPSVLSGAEGSSLLTLYKSPEVVTGTSPKPLRSRVQAAQAEGKVKERGLRSQFACTYVEDDPPLNRVLDFPSSSQLPTCKHPAPKRPAATRPALTSDWDGDSKATSKGSHGLDNVCDEVHPPAVDRQRVNSVSVAALGSRQGNVKTRPAKETQKKKKKSSSDALPLVGKSVKRKHVDGADVSGEENQPPAKKPPPKAPGAPPGKKTSKAPNKKLIAGQGKLTGFFRL
ncbi:PCNA-interacting partner [Clupea harengus]|uniref:PCNA-interacting partner n=1 Tax=Clupea harengus TaxID=7950 RepID=A0A6P3W0F8_CLUHA|nr:PCNA-interacting partner [Clupea harengus]